MKKSKGFTLSELLAVIVILGILIGIGTPIYFRISNNVREDEYKSKIDYIKTKAIKYAEEIQLDGSQTILASTLISNGLVNADKYVEESGVDIPLITDPRDESKNLACRLIEITQDGYEYTARVTEEENCSMVANAEKLDGVKAYKIANNKVIKELSITGTDAEWSNADVALVIDRGDKVNKDIEYVFTYQGKTKRLTITDQNRSSILTNIAINSTINNLDNYNNVAVFSSDNDAKIEVNISVRYDNSGIETVQNATVYVQIDKTEPTVTNSVYNGWTNKGKDITAYVSDGSGSGAAGALVTESSTRPTNIEQMEFTPADSNGTVQLKGTKINGNDEDFRMNGEYYVWAKDKAGNISSTPKYILVTNVDNSTQWTNQVVELYYGCEDKESGCKYVKDLVPDKDGNIKNNDNGNIGISTLKIVFNGDEQYGLFKLPAFEISDNAGNVVTCEEQDMAVYYDKHAPECYVAGENTAWRQSPAVPITYGCRDTYNNSNNTSYNGETGVGCESTTDSVKTYPDPSGNQNVEIDTVSLPTFTIKDKLGNTRVCNETASIKYDHLGPVITVYKNPLPRDNSNYELVGNTSTKDGGVDKNETLTATCNPSNTSQKGNTGSYPVSCSASDRFGNSTTVTFTAKHQYKATYNPKTCTRQVNCHDAQGCSSYGECCGCRNHNNNCGTTGKDGIWYPACCEGQECSQCCKQSYTYTACDTQTYDCSYYTCPDGGSLSGDTCYY